MLLFHDYTSAASAVAVARAQRLADEGLPIGFEGLDALGVDVALPVTLDVAADLDRLAAVAAAEGVVLRRPSALPPTLRAHAVAAAAAERGRDAAWRRVCYAAFWRDGVDLADEHVLADLAVRAGLEADEARAACTDQRRLTLVRRRMAGRRREGVGGVPVLLAHHTLVPGLVDDADLRALAEL